MAGSLYSAELLKEFDVLGLQAGVTRIRMAKFGELNFASMSLARARELHHQKLKYLVKKTKAKSKDD